MAALWEDPWTTSGGSDPLPDYDENVWTEIDDPSGDEVTHALATLRGSTFLAMSAAAKFKGLLKRSSTANSQDSGATTPPAQVGDEQLVASPGESPVLNDSPQFVDSPTGTPALSSAPLAQGSFPSWSNRRPSPRYRTTMSSLSLGEATSRMQRSPPSSRTRDSSGAGTPSPGSRVTQQPEEPGPKSASPTSEPDQRDGDAMHDSPVSSPTAAEPETPGGGPDPNEVARSSSPETLYVGTDTHGDLLSAGIEDPSQSMAEAGVDREDLERLQAEDEDSPDVAADQQVWEDPE